MKKISELLDSGSSNELCHEMVECDIANREAHVELSSYQATGKFAGVHPIVLDRQEEISLVSTLQELRDNDPDAFLREVTITNQNARRIESNIRREKYKNEEELKSWKLNLKKTRVKLKILSSLISVTPD